MKICALAVPGLKPGKHNLKDPRLDQADKLVEASKKTYAQVDLIGEEIALEADVYVVTVDTRADLLLKDLEFVETRLGRSPQPAEQAVLEKIKTTLENDRLASEAGLTAEDLQAIAAHSFFTNKPVVVAQAEDLENPEALLLRAFREGGYISFLTVGGKENRAWAIRKGTTAWDAGGAIHSDIQKGFIRAEIISFDDFIQARGETQAKRAGKQRLETKTYVMQDYDLVNFRFNK
jgi:ribosome-binding ATPase YchF (GTP1/OBG family)